MSTQLTLYQTLKNLENPDIVERDGPFICTWENSWLGTGYYFWEAWISNAHWWGEAHVKGPYFICESNAVMTKENCFDLVGDTAHMKEFEAAVDKMQAIGMLKGGITTVSRILNYLQTRTVFKYEATRAVGYNSIGEEKHKDKIFRMFYEKPKTPKRKGQKPIIHLLDYRPPIQFCLYKKSSMSHNSYRIIYPYEYISDYVL